MDGDNYGMGVLQADAFSDTVAAAGPTDVHQSDAGAAATPGMARTI